jgi:hypothetical protein
MAVGTSCEHHTREINNQREKIRTTRAPDLNSSLPSPQQTEQNCIMILLIHCDTALRLENGTHKHFVSPTKSNDGGTRWIRSVDEKIFNERNGTESNLSQKLLDYRSFRNKP